VNPADLDRLAAARAIAVVRVERMDDSAPVVDALRRGGMTAIELTWTSPDAATALATAREQHGPELVLGAGTLRSPADVEEAVAAGADFVVSPHFEPELCGAMVASGRLALPGVLTPTEVAGALDAGAEAVKLFPSSLGGISHMKALWGPFPGLPVVPTGGIGRRNAAEWLDAGALAVGVGGELCPPEAIANRRWDLLTERAADLLAALDRDRSGR
jgi:2-dehydro-3-deoxyphosphogluconate aldolase / (4S)-4-hydroxy-2-oxoglutarate aldolase